MSSKLIANRATIVGDAKAPRDDGAEKVHQDIVLLNQRIALLKGETAVPAPSPFVSGIRSIADQEKKLREIIESKQPRYDQLFEKICELDRLILLRTAPESNGAPQRRKSAGGDLYTIPTHLHVVDRLLDIFSQSQRVTVIRTTANSGSLSVSGDGLGIKPQPPSPETKVVDMLKQTVAKLTKQLEDSETQKHHLEHQVNQGMIEIEKLKRQLEMPVKPEVEPRNQEEVALLHQQIAMLNQNLQVVQDKLESEIANYQAGVNILMGRVSRLNSAGEYAAAEDAANTPSEMRNALHLLDAALLKKIAALRSELNLMHSLKEALESELSSSNLQRDLLAADQASLTAEHEALKGAYHALSYETASQQMKAKSGDLSLQSQLDDAKALATNLQNELFLANSKLKQLDIFAAEMADLQSKVQLLQDEKSRLESSVASGAQEIAQYKKLTETLKAKLMELSSSVKGGQSNKEFLETFEEVMREEMMTMKGAFEARLKAAREEADATSKRHQVEIARLQATSPFLVKTAGAAAAGAVLKK